MRSWLQRLWRRIFGSVRLETRISSNRLAEIIRDLIVQMENLSGPVSPYDKTQIELNFSKAVTALIELGRTEQAAVLCKRAPTQRIPFTRLLKNVPIENGLKLAIACMHKEDWSTALRLLDWALTKSEDSRSHARILTAAAKISRHIFNQDEVTFHAKIVTLQLSPFLSEHVLAAARMAG